MTLVTQYQADLDVTEAARWLELLNTGSGDRFLSAVEDFLNDLPRTPRQFERVNRPPRGREVRQGQVRGYEFLVTYEVTATQLVVWSVGHARQRSQPWRRRLAP